MIFFKLTFTLLPVIHSLMPKVQDNFEIDDMDKWLYLSMMPVFLNFISITGIIKPELNMLCVPLCPDHVAPTRKGLGPAAVELFPSLGLDPGIKPCMTGSVLKIKCSIFHIK